jgi:hypothetical protein
MDISEQAGIFHFLKTKGFDLQESTPERLRFEKPDDSSAEIVILNNPDSLPVKIKIGGETTDYTATDFDDLMSFLNKTLG